MNAKRPPGGEHRGPADQQRGGGGSVLVIVARPGDILPLHRFGQPSNYSLDPLTLAVHIRQLRRAGWQSWEIRERFGFGEAA